MRAVKLKLEPRSVGVHVRGKSGDMRSSTSPRYGGVPSVGGVRESVGPTGLAAGIAGVH